MAAVLLDTHVWAWTLLNDAHLTDVARKTISAADAVYVSAITFYEIGQKVRIGKWPEMEASLPSLPQILNDQGGFVATLSPAICLRASTMDWDHRDPFDRLIAATAELGNLALISADTAFDTGGSIARVW